MKKGLAIALLALLSIGLVGCEDNDKIEVTSIAIDEKYDSSVEYTKLPYSNYTYDIDMQNLNTLIKEKYSFAFIFESSSCSSCISLKPSLFQYIIKNKVAFYSFDADKYDPFYLYSEMTQIKDIENNRVFDNNEGTPTFMFFSNGVLKEKLPKTSSMNNYPTLKRILNRRLKTNKATLIKDTATLNAMKDNNKILFSSNTSHISKICYYLSSTDISFYTFHLNLNNLGTDFFSNNQLEKTSNTLRAYQNGLIVKELEITPNTTNDDVLSFFE